MKEKTKKRKLSKVHHTSSSVIFFFVSVQKSLERTLSSSLKDP